MTKKIALIIVVLVLFAFACNASATVTRTPTPGSISDSIAGVIDSYGERMLYTSTPPPANPTPEPPSAGDIAATVAWAGISAGMTQQAASYQQHNAEMTQTAIALRAEATQNARATVTAEYWRALAHSDQQTAVAQQATLIYPATATSYSWTQTAIPLEATSNAARLYAEQTVVVGSAIQVSVDANNAAWKSVLQTAVPTAAISAALVIIGFYVYKMAHFKKLDNDGSWSVEGKKGVKQVLQLSRMFPPILTLDPQTASAKPGGMVSEATQEGVTQRAQKVEALAAVPPQNPGASFSLLNRLFGGGRPPININFIAPETAPLDDFEEGLDDNV